MKPVCIDLFCGLGGWSDGFLAEGYECVGFDVERHDYGTGGYPGQLVLQDVLTIHGSQFRNAAVIVASPPCQRYSYMAMAGRRRMRTTDDVRIAPRPGDVLQRGLDRRTVLSIDGAIITFSSAGAITRSTPGRYDDYLEVSAPSAPGRLQPIQEKQTDPKTERLHPSGTG